MASPLSIGHDSGHETNPIRTQACDGCGPGLITALGTHLINPVPLWARAHMGPDFLVQALLGKDTFLEVI